MDHEPIFWVVAIISVLVTGISKGGFGGIALLAVPLMALVISPVKAAGIMLPILIVMDLVSVWSYRGVWDKKIFMLTAPGALLGILIGTLLAGFVDEQFVSLCVGFVAIIFPIYVLMKRGSPSRIAKNNKPLGLLAGAASGFTSFIAHAGAPPFQAYVIPQGLEKRVFVGTSVMFFFVVNTIKLIPYAMLGQFDRSNITTSLILIPLAPIGVLIGVWLVKRINQELFFKITYVFIFLIGVKLLFDVSFK